MKGKIAILGFLIITGFAVLSTGCNDPQSPIDDSLIITTIVRDSVTGLPLSEAEVGFGQNTGLTDAKGEYSFKIKPGESISGSFYASKGTKYDFHVIDGIDIEPSSSLTYEISLTPLAAVGHQLSGKIYENDGTTEISDGTTVDFVIYNENGGSYTAEATYSSGYVIDTPTFGTSCFISLVIDDGTSVYSYYEESVDLSSVTVGHDFVKPSTGFSTITVNGTDGDSFSGNIMYSDSITIEQVSGDLSGADSADIDIYNPDSKEFFWSNMITEIDSPASGDVTISYAMTSPSVPGSSIELPTAGAVTAPVATVSDITYNNGVLSFSGDAETYMIQLFPDEGGLSGDIYSSKTDITLPEGIQNILSSNSDGYTNWDIQVFSINATIDFEFDTILESSQNDGFTPDVSFKMFFNGTSSVAEDIIQ